VTFARADAAAYGRSLPEASVHAIVTSPPYWGQREYGVGEEGGELGLERFPFDYVDRLAETLNAWAKALRPDGTLWLNLGDATRNKRALRLPNRVADALERLGWVVRSEVVWVKPNAMPGASASGPIRAHEHVFRLSRPEYLDALAGSSSPDPFYDPVPEKLRTGQFPRSVWKIPVGRLKGAHLAAMPVDLALRCVRSSTSPRVCASCGAPRVRTIDRKRIATRPGTSTKLQGGEKANRDTRRHITKVVSRGFRPSCDCDASDAPSVVADPFTGSGTTAVVAAAMGRSFVGCDLSDEYLALARRRVRDEAQGLREAWRKSGERDLVDGLDDFVARPRACVADRAAGPRRGPVGAPEPSEAA
jgi:DNA modification methylase